VTPVRASRTRWSTRQRAVTRVRDVHAVHEVDVLEARGSADRLVGRADRVPPSTTPGRSRTSTRGSVRPARTARSCRPDRLAGRRALHVDERRRGSDRHLLHPRRATASKEAAVLRRCETSDAVWTTVARPEGHHLHAGSGISPWKAYRPLRVRHCSPASLRSRGPSRRRPESVRRRS